MSRDDIRLISRLLDGKHTNKTRDYSTAPEATLSAEFSQLHELDRTL